MRLSQEANQIRICSAMRLLAGGGQNQSHGHAASLQLRRHGHHGEVFGSTTFAKRPNRSQIKRDLQSIRMDRDALHDSLQRRKQLRGSLSP
jgi:hypothetical protein